MNRLLKTQVLAASAYCPNCQHRLRAMKGNEFNLKCWECGDEVPIKSIKFDTALAMVDNAPSTIIQAKNWKRGFKPKEKNPIEQELEGRGLQVIDTIGEIKSLDRKDKATKVFEP